MPQRAFRKPSLLTTFINLYHSPHSLTLSHSFTTQLPRPSPVDPNQLLRVCTILYQQQNSPETRLHSRLDNADFQLTHEFFLQVCNNFPYSWRPVYRFFQYTQSSCSGSSSRPMFVHNSVTFNKMVDLIGKSRNIELFWCTLKEMVRRKLVNDKTLRIALKTLAEVRELNKCVEFLRLANKCSLDSLNKVVETLCRGKLVGEAKFVVFKLRDCVKPCGVTYGWLVKGFCDTGNLIEASKIWNLMVDQGVRLDVDVVDKMMEMFFKKNKFGEALKLFEKMKDERMNELGLSSYRLVICWLCKRGKVAQAMLVFDEMRVRGIEVDHLTLSAIVYGLLARGRIREGYRIVEGIEKPDISLYHGLIKGLLKLRKPSEATQVFREMIKRGCEPIMHTYIMLLQGHLGKRGRKGPHSVVNFDNIFVGGLVKVNRRLEATKYVERILNRGLDVPRFDYNRFLYYFSNEEGVVMFEEVAKKLREAGSIDLADIFQRYGEKMATRDRRRNREVELWHPVP